MTSPCHELLERCLDGQAWTAELLDRAIAVEEGRQILSVVVERLGDLFEPRLAQVYEDLFSEVIARVTPNLQERLRRGPGAAQIDRDYERVYVLSRITLGADIAVTSVAMDAAKRRWPSARILFVGPEKNYELFAGDPQVEHFPAPYARGGALPDRLEASAGLWLEDGLVLDPDSRLTQLGLIRVCPEDRYLFFDSRSYGGEGLDRLPDLVARWSAEVLGVSGAGPFIALEEAGNAGAAPGSQRDRIAVNLGVGGNQAKRLDGGFERELLAALVATGRAVTVDLGGDAEERERVEQAVGEAASPLITTHDGSFASFARSIAASGLFVGYDSAAGHAASASGVPSISIAKGFANERMAARWRPKGLVIDGEAEGVLERVREALASLG